MIKNIEDLQRITTHLPSVKIFKDDIEEIISKIKLAELFDIKFEENKKNYTEKTFYQLRKDKLTHLSINAKNSNDSFSELSIKFEKDGGVTLASYNDLKCLGLIKIVENHLKQLKRFLTIISFLFFKSLSLICIGGACLLFNSYMIEKYAPTLETQSLIPILKIILCLLIASFVSKYFIEKPFLNNIISLKYKTDSPGFLSRNKDKIIVGVILALITYFISKIF